MNKWVKGLCVFFGIIVGNLFLNGACINDGSYAAPEQISQLMIMIFTWWGAISLFLKISSFITRHKN